MRVLILGALPGLLVFSACSGGSALSVVDSGVGGTGAGQGSPDRPTRDDGSGGNGDSDGGGGGSGGASAGGAGGSGSPADAASCQGSVVFRLDAPDPGAWGAIDAFQDGPGWLSIHDAVGSEVQIGHPDVHYCSLASCGTCQFDVVCMAAFTGVGIPATLTWDGTMFPPGHCGADAKACVMDNTCAPAGHYDARMCAYRVTDQNGPPTCLDVPFDLPASAPVVGTLPS